jgi:hypothetical protein
MVILKFQVKTPFSMLTTHWANNLPNMFQNFQTLPGSSRPAGFKTACAPISSFQNLTLPIAIGLIGFL